ncbi:hypothetical protein K439DRAFT_1622608 [Ramaria rubella]|nr:hypothetical protein K439DRAFT_1622608 [Ramaria rubella]
MSGRPQGHPPKKHTPHGRMAAKLHHTITQVFSCSSAEPPSEGEATAPSPPWEELGNGVRVLNSEESAFLTLDSQQFGRPLSAFASSLTEAPLFLDTIRQKKPHWKCLGRFNTVDLPHWFDVEHNDYNAWKAHTNSDCVALSSFGHPGNTPVDIRAQQFIVHWKEPNLLSLPACEEAILQKRVVVWWEYMCRGICSAVDSATDKDGSQDDSSEAKAGSGKAMAAPAKWGRWDLCEGGIEITAEDLTTATIWQFSKHLYVKPEQGLHWSCRLCNLVSEWLHLGGAKVSTVQKELIAQYNFLTQTSRPTNAPTHIPTQFPEFQRPTVKQLRSRIHDGIGCDTNWQNKNENRAAVMFLTVVDGNGHLAPGSAICKYQERDAHRISQGHHGASDNQSPRDCEKSKRYFTHRAPGDREEILWLADIILKDGWNPERPLSKSDSLTVVVSADVPTGPSPTMELLNPDSRPLRKQKRSIPVNAKLVVLEGAGPGFMVGKL